MKWRWLQKKIDEISIYSTADDARFCSLWNKMLFKCSLQVSWKSKRRVGEVSQFHMEKVQRNV